MSHSFKDKTQKRIWCKDLRL